MLDERVLIDARDTAHALWEEIRGAMVEIDRPASLALCCLLAAGHLLVEDVPGVGKTTLAKVIARAIGGHDSRIQCTEDLTAAGVIGQEIESTNPALRARRVHPGPALRQRRRARRVQPRHAAHAVGPARGDGGARRHGRQAPPRAAAAVLLHRHDEPARQQRHVRDGARLVRPLRHAHRHRLPVGERRARPAHALRQLRRCTGETDPIVAPGDVVQLQKVIAQIPAGEPVRAYLVRLLRSTRDHPDVLVGASPRALLSMFRCAQAAALLRQRRRGRRQARAQPLRAVHRAPHPRAPGSLGARRVRGDPRAHARARHHAAADDRRHATGSAARAAASSSRPRRQRQPAARVRRCSSTTGSSRSSCHQRASRFSVPTNARSASSRPASPSSLG